MGNNYMGHTYTGHTYIGHNYMGRTYTGHTYIHRSGLVTAVQACVPMSVLPRLINSAEQ